MQGEKNIILKKILRIGISILGCYFLTISIKAMFLNKNTIDQKTIIPKQQLNIMSETDLSGKY